MGAAQGTVQGSTGSINLQIRGGWGHCDQPHRLCFHPHTACTHSQGLPTVMLPMPGSPWGGVGGPQGCQTKGHRVWPPPFQPWGPCSFSPEKRIFSCFLPTGTNRNCLNGCIALGTGPFGAEPHAGKGKPRGHFNNKQGELLKCFTASLRQSNLCVYLEKKNWLAGVFIVTEVGVFWHGWDPACFICLFSYLIPALNSPRAAQGQQQAGSGPGRPGGRLWIHDVGCFPPTGALHPIAAPTFQPDAGPGVFFPRGVWNVGSARAWAKPKGR